MPEPRDPRSPRADRPPAATAPAPSRWRGRLRAAAAGLALAAAGAAPLAAQFPAAGPSAEQARLEELLGQRVRIEVSGFGGRRYAGLLDSVRAGEVVVDTITNRPQTPIFGGAPPVLDRYRRVTVPIESIREVQISRGTSRLRGALWGGLIGAGLVGMLEAFGGTQLGRDPNADSGAAFARGAVIGTVLGAPVGYFFGRERWGDVRWPPAREAGAER